jgi:delta1-piperideine-2-carboxylate reductase
MRMSIDEARSLLEAVMRNLGYDDGDDKIIADHLIDCELRGLHQGGMARALSIAERIARTSGGRGPIRIKRETAISAQIDGGDNIGYVVARRATQLAIEKASKSGIAIVGARNTWYTGMLSYYAEMAVAADLVAIIASNASPWVAPHGANQGRFGTNPICFGFPSTAEPVIWDIGTSSIIHADVVLNRRLGKSLPEGVAYDSGGQATTDPAAALAGAFIAWGGPKGSGLGLVVHLLGMMAGSAMTPPELAEFGFLIILIDPGLMTSADEFKTKVAEYVDWVHTARPVDSTNPVRVPFERSRYARDRRIENGTIELSDVIYSCLVGLVQQ